MQRWLRGLSPLVVLWLLLGICSLAGIAGATIAVARSTAGDIEADLATGLTADYGQDPVRVSVPPLDPKLVAVAAVDRRLFGAPPAAPAPRPTPTTWLLLFLSLRITNNGGGTLTPTNVALFVDGAPVSGASLLVPEGPHVVGVDARASGYRLSFEGDCDPSGRVVLVAGQTANCTVILDDLP